MYVLPVRTARPDAPTSRLSLGSRGQSVSRICSSPGRVQAAQEADLRVDDIDPGAVAVEQPERLVDGVLDHRLRGRVRRRSGCRARAASARWSPGARSRPPRAVELLDEPRVGHRERRVVGRGGTSAIWGAVNASAVVRERAERPEHLVARGQRRHDPSTGSRSRPRSCPSPLAWDEPGVRRRSRRSRRRDGRRRPCRTCRPPSGSTGSPHPVVRRPVPRCRPSG